MNTALIVYKEKRNYADASRICALHSGGRLLVLDTLEKQTSFLDIPGIALFLI